MPKEKIWSNGTTKSPGEPLVVVQWQRGQYVSVGVEIAESDESGALFTNDLSWKQLNDLIIVLKRARDQVFGRPQ